MVIVRFDPIQFAVVFFVLGVVVGASVILALQRWRRRLGRRSQMPGREIGRFPD